jgi:hypothetical protein
MEALQLEYVEINPYENNQRPKNPGAQPVQIKKLVNINNCELPPLSEMRVTYGSSLQFIDRYPFYHYYYQSVV